MDFCCLFDECLRLYVAQGVLAAGRNTPSCLAHTPTHTPATFHTPPAFVEQVQVCWFCPGHSDVKWRTGSEELSCYLIFSSKIFTVIRMDFLFFDRFQGFYFEVFSEAAKGGSWYKQTNKALIGPRRASLLLSQWTGGDSEVVSSESDLGSEFLGSLQDTEVRRTKAAKNNSWLH